MINGKRVIAVCIAGVDEEYNKSFLWHLAKYAKAYGMKVLYFESFSDLYSSTSHDAGEANIFHLINHNNIDGMIILAQTIKSDEVLDDIVHTAQNRQIPVVVIDKTPNPYMDSDYCYSINFNYEHTMEQILRHVIEVHDARKINFIAGIKGNEYSEQRLNIYRKVLAEYNIPIEEERIGYGDFWYEPTNKVIDRFISSSLPFPDAIVCANDSMAIAAHQRLTEMGYHVPDDVILTGFDGISEVLQHLPSITTAQHNIPETVCAAYDALKKVFDGEPTERNILIDSKFVCGGSCGCPSNQILHHNRIIRSLHNQYDMAKGFDIKQMRMLGDLTDRDSFQAIFEGVKHYTNDFSNEHFWLCIVDNFLSEEEFSDILESSHHQRTGYSSRMDLLLHRCQGEWQGMMDFETDNYLPNLETVLEDTWNIIFFPLHAQSQTIGYAAFSFDDGDINIPMCYKFFMNISTLLDVHKSHQRQQIIIENLENKYVHDPLTGLFNRRGFYQKVTTFFDDCKASGERIMVISVDLNGLKPINDTHGHAAGDIAISTIAKALMTCSKPDDVCARFGGDEFVVAGPVDSEEAAQDYINRVQAYLSDFNQTSGKPYQVSASFGLVSAIPNEAITLDEFISEADEKMYSEKARHHLGRRR